MTEVERIKTAIEQCEIYPGYVVLPSFPSGTIVDDILFLIEREEKLRKSLKQVRSKLAGIQSHTRRQWDCDSDYLPYEEDERDR